MIQEFVDCFMANRRSLKEQLEEERPGTYEGLVRMIAECLVEWIDPERITRIDDGDYQGTQLFILGEEGYQPSRYYAVYVNYGSCSGCDTLERVKNDGDLVEDYMTMLLHIVQNIKEI